METEDVLDEDLGCFSGGRQLGEWNKVCRFREPVDNGKYKGLPLRFRQNSDEVNGDV